MAVIVNNEEIVKEIETEIENTSRRSAAIKGGGVWETTLDEFKRGESANLETHNKIANGYGYDVVIGYVKRNGNGNQN